jgi:hypothetical protein
MKRVGGSSRPVVSDRGRDAGWRDACSLKFGSRCPATLLMSRTTTSMRDRIEWRWASGARSHHGIARL